MRTVMLGAAIAIASTMGLAAQSTKVQSESEIDVKKGEKVEVTGCLERSASGAFVLTLVEDEENAEGMSPAYFLVGEEDALEDHLGHLVRIEGKATDKGDDAEIEVRTKTKVEREDADDRETESETRLQGNLAHVPYLGVQDIEMIRSTC